MNQYHVKKFMCIDDFEDWLDEMNESCFDYDVVSVVPCSYVGCRLLVTFRLLYS